jgi:zinc protease
LKLNCHKNKLEQALKALESVITEPLFPEKQFGREKNNCLDSLKTRALDPRAAAEDKLIKLLFGEHPYSRPQTGQEKTVKKFTAEKLRKFYFEKCLNPGKAVFGVAGDIDEDEIKEKISAFSDIIPWNTSPAPFNVPPPVFPKLPVRDSVTLPREQAVVISAMPSCDMLDEDYYALDFLYPVLNGQASPLFKAVREKEGLAYFTGMYMTRGIHRGALGFYAGTHPAAAGKVIAILDSERLKLAEKGISKGDFNAAKACVRQIISEQFEKTETLILNSALSEYYGKGFMNPWEKWKIYDSLSREKVNRVIRKYFDTDSRVTVSAGPGPA